MDETHKFLSKISLSFKSVNNDSCGISVFAEIDRLKDCNPPNGSLPRADRRVFFLWQIYFPKPLFLIIFYDNPESGFRKRARICSRALLLPWSRIARSSGVLPSRSFASASAPASMSILTMLV